MASSPKPPQTHASVIPHFHPGFANFTIVQAFSANRTCNSPKPRYQLTSAAFKANGKWASLQSRFRGAFRRRKFTILRNQTCSSGAVVVAYFQTSSDASWCISFLSSTLTGERRPKTAGKRTRRSSRRNNGDLLRVSGRFGDRRRRIQRSVDVAACLGGFSFGFFAGECPLPSKMTTCSPKCKDDIECPGQRCCKNICNTLSCTVGNQLSSSSSGYKDSKSNYLRDCFFF